MLVQMHFPRETGEAQRIFHGRLVLGQRGIDGGEHRPGLDVARLAEILESLLEALQLLFDGLPAFDNVFRPRIKRDAEFGAVQRQHVLIGAGPRQGALRRAAYFARAVVKPGEGGNAQPAQSDGDRRHERDDRKNLGKDLGASEKGHSNL